MRVRVCNVRVFRVRTLTARRRLAPNTPNYGKSHVSSSVFFSLFKNPHVIYPHARRMRVDRDYAVHGRWTAAGGEDGACCFL